ncbi:MAG: DUF4439 domain-containing protein [Actinomycetota bacterium]
MSANDGMPHPWSRRAVLIALAAGSVTAVSGCRVQLEGGKPSIPAVAVRRRIKDESALLTVLEETRSLESLANAVSDGPASIAGQLALVHHTQAAVIESSLRQGGVAQALLGSSATSVLFPRTLHPPVLPLGVLSAAESGSLGDVALADLSTARVALIGSLLAQRVAAVTLLGGTVVRVPSSGPNGGAGVPLLEATRAAVYGFEVVAAQMDSRGMALAVSTLAAVRSEASELESLVGPSAPPPPLGYRLPFSVLDANSARRLAMHLIKTLLSAQAAALEPAVGDSDTLCAVVRRLAESESISSRWGVAPAAFPGLTSPR